MHENDIDDVDIRDAYTQITADGRPAALLSDVRMRMRSRRRNRMARRASGLVACAIGLGVGISAWTPTGSTGPQHFDDLAASSDDDTTSFSVVMERRGAGSVELTGFMATCQSVPSKDGVVKVLRLVSDAPAGTSAEDSPSFFLQGGVDDLVAGRVLTLPLDDLGGGSERTPLNFEAAAWFPSASGAAEASSTAPASAGTVTIVDATCDGKPAGRIEVDLTLQTDDGGAPIRVTGTAVSH